MKRKFTQCIMLLLAFVFTIPQSYAVEYELSVNTTADWKQSVANAMANSIMKSSPYIYMTAAATDDKIFTVPASSVTSDYPTATVNSTTYHITQGYLFSKDGQEYWSGGTKESAFKWQTSGTYLYLGPAIASDDAGTLWIGSRRSSSAPSSVPWGMRPKAVTYYIERPKNASGGNRAGIDLSGETYLARADLMSAYGDGINANSVGYLWFAPNNQSVVECFVIKEGKLSKRMTFPSPKAVESNRLYIKQFAPNRFLWAPCGGKLYVGTSNASTVENSTTITWVEKNLNVVRHGATAFVLNGHEVIAYSSSTTNVTLYDLTDDKAIGTITPFTTESSIGTISHSLDAKVSGNTASLYVYVPEQGAAKYTITATEVTEYTDPVSSLTASLKFVVSDKVATQYATLTWKAPSSNASHVTGYKIYRGDTEIATVGNDVLTYTDTEVLTATTTYKVIPTYDSNTVGTDVTATITPHTFKAPKNLTVTAYDGYARAQIQWEKAENDPSGIKIRYDLYRDEVLYADNLARIAFMDTKIPEGTHSYRVESVYYIDNDGDGEYTDEIARLSVGPVSTEIQDIEEQLVNYTLEVVYNHTMWDIWDAGNANGVKWYEMGCYNFNPTLQAENSSGKQSYVDAEHYRQGALVTDKNGKKWWYIAQKSTTWDLDLKPDYEGEHGAGILKISAEDADLKIGGTPTYYKGAELPIVMKNGQTVGIAADDEGNIFVRGHTGETGYGDYMNFTKPLSKGIIYTPDFSKGYEVDLSSVDFSPERTAQGYGSEAGETFRTDYYRLSGKLISEGKAYLYGSASHSRTMTVVELKYDSSTDKVTVGEVYQYTPTAYSSNGKEIPLDAGSENYAFPIEGVSTGIGSLGHIYQRRSNGYFYVPEGTTTENSHTDVLTTYGKIANAGGTTVRMVNDEGATQLFLIAPESFYSQNIGSFSVNVVTDNDFTTGIVPVANMNQTDIIPNGEITNVNGNWLFAEYDATDECIYIYQYVPGTRIAKYRLYGAVSYYSVPPVLDIKTVYHEEEGDITNFQATCTWKTPEDYTGTGDYVICHYEVNLLDNKNRVLDTRIVDADTITATYIPGSDIIKEYTLTFECLSDITDQSVSTGGTSANYFVDDDTKYTVEVTAVYNSKIAEDAGIIGGLRRSATQTAQAEHAYVTTPPVPTIDIYKGTSGGSTGVYRIEIGLETPLDSDEKVSHYELYYTRKKVDWNTPDASTASGFAETEVTEQMTDFILVTTGKARSVTLTEGQDVIPGNIVRNGQSGYYLEGTDGTNNYGYSQNPSYAVYFYDSNVDMWTEYDNDPTTWTYTVKAVYADDNALLRKTTEESVTVTPGSFTPTDVDEIADEIAGLNAYPIPADTELTVQSGQTIEQIIILSTTGAEVKRIDGNGELKMTIDVEDLASGYYFLKVNNLPVMKIVKK